MAHTPGAVLNIGVGSITRTAGRGNTRASNHNMLKGKNWVGGSPFLEQPSDRTGALYVARLDMNLNRDNIKGHRKFESLLSTNMLSSGRAIRGILDSRGSRSGKCSPLINPLYGFNTLIDNTALSVTGWPNNVSKVTPTPPNERGASSLVIEGKHESGKTFDLNMEHLNTEGDMVSQMYSIMGRYPELLRTGEVELYFDNLILDRCDWKSRIYRFIFDRTGHFVEQFTMTGEAFPVSDSTGNAMNYSVDTSINDGYDTVSAQWMCGGYFHNDPIVIDEFNKTQIMHNPSMMDGIRENVYYRVGADENLPSLAVADLYQYMGYPRINPLTMEFEIWVDDLTYNIMRNYNSVDELVTAMALKNDEDIRNGMTSYDQETLREVMGRTYDDLPLASLNQTSGSNT